MISTALSMDQIAQYAYNAGFKGKGLSIAVAVAMAESRGDPNSTGRVGEKGLWQIYPRAHPDWDRGGNLYDPAYNARAAFAISSSGTNWTPWTTYKLGLYLVWLNQAEVAAQRVEHLTAEQSRLGGAAEALTHVPGFGSGTEQVGQTGLGALSSLAALPETFNRIGQWISTPANWTRVAQVAVGGVLLLLALSAISKPVTEPIVKTVGALK